MGSTEGRIAEDVGQLFDTASNEAADRLLEFAKEAAVRFKSGDPAQALTELDTELDNLKAGQAWVASRSEPQAMELSMAYVDALGDYLLIRGLYSDLESWAGKALACCEEIGRSSCRFLLIYGEAKRMLGNWSSAMADFQRATAACGKDTQMYAKALFALGRLQLNQGYYEEGLENLRRSLNGEKEEENGSLWEITVQEEIASYRMNHGDLDQALPLFFESVRARKGSGRKLGIEMPLVHIGVIYRKKRNYRLAEQALLECETISTEIGDQNGIAWANHHLGWVYLNQGKYQEAYERCATSTELYEELGDVRGVSDCYEQRGMIQLAREFFDDALADLQLSLDIRTRIKNCHGIASSLRHIATVLFLQRAFIRASLLLWKSLKIYQSIGVLNRERFWKIFYELYDWTLGKRRWTY
jgi:tetratricopeptide (TPR) repeat protein